MFRGIFLTVLVLSIAGVPSGGARAQPSPGEVEDGLEEAIAQGRKVQEEADQWALERERLLARIRDLENRRRWLEHRKEKHRAYVRNREEAIDRLREKRAGLERLRMELEPYLDEALAKLKAFVEKDLPFLPEERRRRLAFLEEALNDYSVELPEKVRRLLEAFQVEAEYGRGVESYEGSLELEGEPTRVVFFRLGRVGLFYMTDDGGRAGRYDADAERWEDLPSAYARSLRMAVEMAQRKRPMDLVNLPLPPPEAGEIDERE